MNPDDNPTTWSIDDAWVAFTHRTAAVVGSLTALVSLLWDTPVTFASLRGALAWLAVALLGRGTSWLLRRTASSALPARAKAPETS